MRKGKQCLRSLGLANLAALSLLVLGAASAGAADFQISEQAALLATVSGKLEGSAFLLVPNRNLTISCALGDLQSGTEIVNSEKALAKIRLQECIAVNHTTKAEMPCNITPEATIEAAVSVLPIEHGTNTYVLIESDESSSLAVVELTGALCPLPVSNPLKGTIVANVSTNNQVEDLITFSQVVQELLGELVSMGGFDAFVGGSMTLKLIGSHTGRKFGVRNHSEELEALAHQKKLLEEANEEAHKEELEEEEFYKLIEEKALEVEELETLEKEHLVELKELKGPVFKIQGGKALLATFSGSLEAEGSFLAPKRDITVKCAAIDIQGGSEILNGNEALVKFSTLSCAVKSHKTGSTLPCIIDNFTGTAIALPVSHGSAKYVLFEPDKSSTFGTLLILGASCPFPEEHVMQGTFVGQVTTNEAEKPLLTFSQVTQELLKDLVGFWLVAGYLSGTMQVELTGVHKGMKIGVV